MTTYIERPQAYSETSYPIAARARWFAVTAVLAGGVLQLVESLLEPEFSDSSARVDWWLTHSLQLQVSQAVGLLAVPFLIGMILTAYRLVRAESRRIAAVAACVLVTAMVGLAMVHGIELAAHIAAVNGHPGAAAAILDLAHPGIPGVLGFAMFVPMAGLGNILLIVAMWRSSYIPRLAIIPAIAFPVLDLALSLGVAGHVASVLTDAVIAWAVLTRYRRAVDTAAADGAH